MWFGLNGPYSQHNKMVVVCSSETFASWLWSQTLGPVMWPAGFASLPLSSTVQTLDLLWVTGILLCRVGKQELNLTRKQMRLCYLCSVEGKVSHPLKGNGWKAEAVDPARSHKCGKNVLRGKLFSQICNANKLYLYDVNDCMKFQHLVFLDVEPKLKRKCCKKYFT